MVGRRRGLIQASVSRVADMVDGARTSQRAESAHEFRGRGGGDGPEGIGILKVIRQLRSGVRSQSRRSLPDRRVEPTWTGAGGRRIIGTSNTSTACVMAGSFTNDVRLHRDGAGRTVELVV